jgi:hypothetical protein
MKLLLLALLWSLFLAYTRAKQVFRSSGPSSPCAGFEHTNKAYLNVFLTLENLEISYRYYSSGVNASTGNAVFSFALYEDGEQMFLDSGMVLASSGTTDLSMSIRDPERYSAMIGENLLSAKNITAQLWVELLADVQERTECIQTRLRSSDESGGGNDYPSLNGIEVSSGYGNSTGADNGSDSANDEGAGNSTSDNNGSGGASNEESADPNDDHGSDGASNEGSGASVPQVAYSLVM